MGFALFFKDRLGGLRKTERMHYKEAVYLVAIHIVCVR